jgi:protein-S-isoprenylcysteine O-methyltransferase Ste14
MSQSLDGDRRRGAESLLKSLLHNIGVVIVGLGFAFPGAGLDWVLGLTAFHSITTKAVACLLLILGFLLRVWATYHFYQHQMRVISLVPQSALITTGPYRISRNPLYLGGNVFIFLGAVLVLGSPSGIVLTALNVLLVDFMIRREERQLERQFGDEWIHYRSQVRRWI